MCDETYNGYTNFETWLLSLNIDNDQYLQETVLQIVRENIDYEDYDIIQSVKEFLEENFYIEQYGIFHIVDTWTNRDFNEIDFYDLLENWKNTLKEIEEYEKEDG